MIIIGVPLDKLSEYAQRLEFRLHDCVSKSSKSYRYQLQLRPNWEKPNVYKVRKGEIPEHKYQKISYKFDGICSRPWAICWHGFRDYFRLIYADYPDAIIQTSITTYRNKYDFEARFYQTGNINWGSRIYPVMAKHACECETLEASNVR